MASNTLPSDPIPASQIEEWWGEYDVIVVGFGAAGGAAAIEATRAGATTLILEQATRGGGATAEPSAGYVCIPGLGVSVSPDLAHRCARVAGCWTSCTGASRAPFAELARRSTAAVSAVPGPPDAEFFSRTRIDS